ncbi:sphinganine kinase lcb4 [Mucor velutinosus]|uniref:Sphinganine kinase lcb4 n=1 Tax=Mucor velutinosus TaxID=708070 RepID=A0AAN7I477_9FUNG|nr:sphinganine kinase lcb4 [Mucor velutinosus]
MGFFNTTPRNLIFVPAIDPTTAADRHCYRTHKAANTTLTHVMHLFEEKNKYPPVPVSGPLPIKANGAIVVNRPGQQTAASIRSLPLYLQGYESDNEQEELVCISEKKAAQPKEKAQENIAEAKEKEEQEEEEDEYHTTTESSISDNTSSDSNAYNVVHLVHEENHRLRQQILLEREQNEKHRLAKDHYEQELILAKQYIKSLQRATDRFQRILSSGFGTTQSHTAKQLRRQSTGAYFTDVSSTLPTNAMAISYEHKLQILLNEIEAMEQDEMESTKRMTIQRNECDKLMRKIKFKNDIIRQLAYDLQFAKSSR